MGKKKLFLNSKLLRLNIQSLQLFSDKGARYEFRVLAKNEIDYGERAVTIIDTPDGGWYFCIDHYEFLKQ